MHLLEGKGISKNFGGLAAVSHVSFYVDKGEILGLIGPNGAGKTTLFNLISGAIPLKTGIITFNGKQINGLRPHSICRLGIARTFQQAKVFSNMKITENVMIGSMFGDAHHIPAAETERVAGEYLDFVGLGAFKNAQTKDLTLVNQKRLEVARALATNPQLLMLDEVMAGLNPTEVTAAMELIRKINDKGITILMIEHVMKAIMTVCRRIIVLHHGEKLAEGTPQEIANNPTVIEVYLGQ
jgi:branched-chain amino acid transport system ATP-binding protein